MVTLKKEIQISGNGLMKNKPCTVKFIPSKEGKIRYFVGQEMFEADVDNVLATDHCVVLGNKKAKAMLTEHLSAALAFCGIDSIDICMDEIVHDHMMEWHHAMKIKVETLKDKVKEPEEHHPTKTAIKK